MAKRSFPMKLKVKKIKATKKLSKHLRVKCGCCDESIRIFPFLKEGCIEIGGVFGSVDDWRKILLPLLDK
jgi:hypothetical protein